MTIAKGAVFGVLTVKSDVTIVDGKECVQVECWPCKRIGVAQVKDLLAGRVGLCKRCKRDKASAMRRVKS